MKKLISILIVILLAEVGNTPASVTGNSPDLIVVSITAQDTAVEGENIIIQATIGNQGDSAPENTFYIHLYLSEDTTITSSDIYIGDIPYSYMIPPGQSSWTNPEPFGHLPSGITGTYYVGAIVDATGTVNESNENNNTGYDPTQITITPASPPLPSTELYTNHWYPATMPLDYAKAEYEIEFTVRGESILSITVEGPNVPLTNLEYEETYSGGEWRWRKIVGLPGKPSVGDTYTFHITYNNLTKLDITDSVTGVIEEFPTTISPAHGSTITTLVPTFEWLGLTTNVVFNLIVVWETETGKMKWMKSFEDGDSENATSIIYNSDSTGESLEAGKSYGWVLMYKDTIEDNRAYILSEFTIKLEVGVKEHPQAINFVGQNHPNPFNPITTIAYSIAEDGIVTFEIYDISGRKVATLVDTYQKAGNYSVVWDASGMAAGIYFYLVKTGNFLSAKRMVLLK